MTSFIFKNPPFAQCHAVTLARLSVGQIAAAWFAGTREMHPDTSIWFSRQDGDSWTQPRVKAKHVWDSAHWNPVIHPLGDGTVMLYCKVGRFPDSWDTWRQHMDEWGLGLSRPRMLMSTELEAGRMTPGPVRGKVVGLSTGTLLAPSSIEKVVGRSIVGYRIQNDVLWESVIHRSTDGGKTWRPSMVPYRRAKGQLGGIIQPSAWEVRPGLAAALFRSTEGFLYRSQSSDDGRTWSEAEKTSIPNPNSAVDVSRLGDVLAMVYNPVSENWGSRSPLSIAFSNPDGLEWSEPTDLASGPGSFSYPAMVATDDGFAVAYTWNRRLMAFVEAKVRSVSPGRGFPSVVVELVRGPRAYDFATCENEGDGDEG